MGYLDNSTIVVDAILTKHGRKLLASGNGLNINYFTLSDTGIDYTLWNPDHPSGSAYYGEAIENLPNLEALPNASYFMRNNLITLNRSTIKLPYVTVFGVGIAETAEYAWSGAQQSPLTVIPGLEPNNESLGWQLVVPDASLLTVEQWGTPTQISGNAYQYLNDQEIQNSAVYEKDGPGTASEPAVTLIRATTTTDRSLTITFISKSTGAYKHMNLSMDAYTVA